MKRYPAINETLYSFRHESGLPVYVLPKPGFGKSYALFATDFGSIHNEFFVDGVHIKVPDGVAHFLEHKLFEEEQGNVFEKFSALGASANAFTSFDMTGYLFSATENFYEALEVLIQFVQNPYFTEENVEKEKGIIGQEIDMYRDDAEWNCFFGMLGGLYKNHPVHLDIAGTAESIGKIDKTLLYQCYNAFYAPQNMVLFVVGNVEESKVREVVSRVAATKKAPQISFTLPDEPQGIVQEEVINHFMVAKPLFSLGFKEKPAEDPIYAEAVYAVLGALLFGKSMPLYKKLYDEKLIGSTFSHAYTSGHGYAFMQIEGESDHPKRVRELVLEAIGKMRTDGIAQADFDRVKRSVLGKAIRALDNVENIAHSFVPAFFLGGDYLTYCDTVRNLQLSDVRTLLENGLASDKAVLSVIMPKERSKQ